MGGRCSGSGCGGGATAGACASGRGAGVVPVADGRLGDRGAVAVSGGGSGGGGSVTSASGSKGCGGGNSTFVCGMESWGGGAGGGVTTLGVGGTTVALLGAPRNAQPASDIAIPPAMPATTIASVNFIRAPRSDRNRQADREGGTLPRFA